MSNAGPKTWPKLTSGEEFRFLADLVLNRVTEGDRIVSLQDVHGGTTRFANNRIVQNVDTRRGTLTVTVAIDGQRGAASTTDFTAGSIQETAALAERLARVAPKDPVSAATATHHLSDSADAAAGDRRGRTGPPARICQ